jgi:hypothetical protein
MGIMLKDHVRIEQKDDVFLIDCGEEPVDVSVSLAFVALAAMCFGIISILQGTHTYVYAASGIFIILFVCGILFAMASRTWVTEVDTTIRRLKITRQVLGWTKVIVDCSFEECSTLGTSKRDTEEGITYGLHILLKNGNRYRILSNSTLGSAAKLALRLSVATGIPRFDTHALTGP